MPRFYLGVDGGQSSTTALISDETGRIVGRGHGGPCNHVSGAEAQAKFNNALGPALRQAGIEAGFDPVIQPFASACFGFSGGPEDKEIYARQLVHSEKYKFTHDAEIALTGATEGQPGIIIIAGTGSMALGRNAAGRTARAGGWGYIFGDEGGAFDLTRRALRAALQYEEGWGPASRLRQLLLAATAAPDANTLLHRFYSSLSRQYAASLAPLVTQAAEGGDAPAREIVDAAADALVRFIQGVYRNLFRDRETVPVAHIGGVFESALLRNRVVRRVQESIGCPAGPPRFGPAIGAVLEALRLDGNQSRVQEPLR
jgi:N-acetylglucosamine kinase-like BadF-type ATPase